MVTVSMIIMLTLYQRGADFGVFLQPQHHVKRQAVMARLLRIAKGVTLRTVRATKGSALNDKMDSPCQRFGIIVPLVKFDMKESIDAVYDHWY